MSRKLVLTISILISNRPDTVRKCLDSVKPLLEAIPSELILTDTGCGEQVRSIIEEYTDHIIDFEWCRDFSKARNVGLKQAKGEWFLFLDDDEWFEDVSELIDFFKSGEYKKYGLASYVQRNYLDKSGSVYTDLTVGRTVRLEPDIHFIYSIHECFSRVPGEVKMLHSYVHHYGYVYDSREEAMAHTERNISLLLEEHKNHPENMKHVLQLTREYGAIEKTKESLDLSLEGIDYAKHNKIDVEFCLPSLYANVIGCYMESKLYDEAVAKGEDYLKNAPIDPLARAVIEGYLAGAYIEKKQWGKTISCVEHYMQAYEKQRERENVYLPYLTTVTAGCFEQRNFSFVLGSGVYAAIALGKSELALKWFQKIDLASKRIFISNAMVREIVKALADSEERDMRAYLEMSNALAKRSELLKLLITYIKEEMAENPKARSRFAEISVKDWYFMLLKVQVNFSANEKEPFKSEKPFEVEKEDFFHIWKQARESLPDIVKSRLWELADAAGISNREVIEEIPLYLWREALAFYCRNADKESLAILNDALNRYLPEDTWHLEIWKEHYLYAELLRMTAAASAPGKQSEKEKSDCRREMEELWTAYAAVVYNQAEALYQAEVLAEAEELLPAKVQAAKKTLYLQEMVKQGDYAQAVNLIKAVRELMPELDEIIKGYLENLQKLMAQQNQNADQFAQLAGAVKAKIRECIAKKDHQSAEAILIQLEAMLPGDTEVAQLRRQIEDLQC